LEQQKYSRFKAKDFALDHEFKSWINGTSPENDHLWERWLAVNPEKMPEIEKARELVNALHFRNYEAGDQLVETEWKKLQTAIESSADDQKPKIFSIQPSWFLRVAAACVLLISVFAVKQIWFSDFNVNKSALITRTAPKGERLLIKLIDGSTVRLNSGSSLTFPKIFPAGRRELSLVGEAFFEVAPDKNAPFIIHSGKVTTQVLGTTFGIEAYPESGDVRVAVVEGKVKVKSNSPMEKANQEVYLTKNKMATFHKKVGQLAVSEFDSKRQLAWKDGVLYFEKSDFQNVIKKLENWYGVKIQIDSDLALDPEWRFSGKFNNQSLDYILNVVRYPNQFSFEIKNDTVNIKYMEK